MKALWLGSTEITLEDSASEKAPTKGKVTQIGGCLVA